jgi:hypothetical protein
MPFVCSERQGMVNRSRYLVNIGQGIARWLPPLPLGSGDICRRKSRVILVLECLKFLKDPRVQDSWLHCLH